jgi:anti-anti-sigma factor
VNVIELDLPESIDAMEFDRINEILAGVFDGKTSGKWVLDLTGVDYLGSAMLGLIVNIRQHIKQAGGRLVLCGMSSELQRIFHNCSMERLFSIKGTRADAIRSISP